MRALSRWRSIRTLAAFAGALLWALPALAGLSISYVQHEPTVLRPDRGETLTVRFRLSEPARVTLDVYDGRDLRVASVESAGELAAGDQALTWDGTGPRGEPVPPEAYVYTLAAQNSGGEPVLWDRTDLSGGEQLEVEDLEWDPAEKLVRYRLAKPARVRIRVGLSNGGPLLNTLIDWVVRTAGPHAEAWSGLDASSVLDLSDHPELLITPEAFTLPHNAVIVGPAAPAVALIEGLPDAAPKRPARATPRRPRAFAYPSQSIGKRRDFAMALELPAELERDASGLPIVTGAVPVQLGLADADLARVRRERCEIMFFVDGQFVFENEVAFLPLTWTWDPRGANPGVHYISANLLGYAGHFGMSTVKVHYQPEKLSN